MSPRAYVLLFGIAMGALFPVILANVIFLRQSGEMLSAPQVVKLQADGGGLYGTAVNANTYQYKLAIYRETRPTVVVVGSSRVMQFRDWFFSVPFANMGGAMNSLKEGVDLVSDIISIHVPRVMIVGLDFWWFDEARMEHYSDHGRLGSELDANKLMFPLESLANGKVSPRYFMASLVGMRLPGDEIRPIGLLAAVQREGYARDGSYYYVGTVIGHKPSADTGFSMLKDLVNRPETDERRVYHPPQLGPARVEELRRLVGIAQRAGSKVYVFVPPMAPAVIAEMKKAGTHRDFAAMLRTALHDPDVNILDYSDPLLLGSGNCEFIDGSHGGDLLYLRIADFMARRESSFLRGYFDSDRAARLIGRYAGLAMVPNRFQLDAEKEVDFLKLGCAKETSLQ